MIWKSVAVPGLERYQVSDEGHVWSPPNNSHRQGVVLRSTLNKRLGYVSVHLTPEGSNKRKRVVVHRLIALTFIPNPDSKPEVNHKDRDKTNNRVGNLEWVTKSENMMHSYRNGHTIYDRSGANNPNYRHGRYVIG